MNDCSVNDGSHGVLDDVIETNPAHGINDACSRTRITY